VKLMSSAPQSTTSRDSAASCCCYLGAADVSNLDCPDCLHKHSVEILKVYIFKLIVVQGSTVLDVR
jgi:hypothetical protein